MQGNAKHKGQRASGGTSGPDRGTAGRGFRKLKFSARDFEPRRTTIDSGQRSEDRRKQEEGKKRGRFPAI